MSHIKIKTSKYGPASLPVPEGAVEAFSAEVDAIVTPATGGRTR